MEWFLVVGEQSLCATAAEGESNRSGNTVRKTGDIKSRNTEEAENMGQTEKDRESSM